MKKFAKKLAILIVTYYYNRIYKKAVKVADKLHLENGEMYYVVDHFLKGQTLSIINRKAFRRMKSDAQRWTNPNHEMYYSKDYNLQIVKDGCWYHTANRSEECGLTNVDKEARRLFFIKVGLLRAKLIDRVFENEE